MFKDEQRYLLRSGMEEVAEAYLVGDQGKEGRQQQQAL